MDTSAGYMPELWFPYLLGSFSDASKIAEEAKTPGYYIQKAKTLITHGEPAKALEVLAKCSEKFSELPEWQQFDLREITAKVFDELDSIMSPEEIRYRKRQMAGNGIALTDVISSNENKVFM